MICRYRRESQRATAAVEFAVVLPLVVLLLLGAVEFGRAVMVQHTLQEAAQAGCRLYSSPDSDAKAAEEIIADALARAQITAFEIEYDPPTKQEVDDNMEPVTVTVVVNYSDVSWVSAGYLNEATISGRCTMPADITHAL